MGRRFSKDDRYGKKEGAHQGPLLVYSETGFFLIKWIRENQGQRSVGVDNVSVPRDEVLVADVLVNSPFPVEHISNPLVLQCLLNTHCLIALLHFDVIPGNGYRIRDADVVASDVKRNGE